MWTNWAAGQRCVPSAAARPGSRAEVAAIVARAGAEGRRVKAVGSGHSFSACALTDGVHLHLERLDRLLDVDRDAGLVRVEAGISLGALARALHAHGLALPSLGDIDTQTLAGALATATHGTGARLPNLSAQVEAMELILADGSERTLTAADGDLLRAARVGLGALGVVVAVTLRCVPAFRLQAIDAPEPLDAVLAGLDARVDGAAHFEFWTFPHSPLALTRTNTPTEAPRRAPGAAVDWVGEVLVDNHVFGLFNRAARRAPRAIPRLNRLAGRLATRRDRVEDSFRVFASRRLVRFEEMEYAVPRARAAEALLACRAILERHPVSFPVELRFTAGDDALLSPAYGRDSAHVAVHVFAGLDWEAPFREVEAAMGALGGRPHWGKRTLLGAEALAPHYPQWSAFQAARETLDPDGRFANAFTDRLLGTAARAPAAA